MTTTERTSFYSARKTDFSSSLDKTKKKINLISNLRIITALCLLLVVYMGFSNHIWLYALLPLLLLFILFIQQHGKLFRQKMHLENLVRMNQTELDVLQGNYASLSPGNEFIDTQHPYSYDLDLFGPGSLFQYINRSGTYSGKKKLASQLTQPLASLEVIAQHHQAHRELTTRIDLRQHILAYGMEVDEQPTDRKQLQEWINHPSFLYPKKVYSYFLNLFPALTLALVLGAFVWGTLTPFAVLGAILQWVILGYHLKQVNAFHQYISQKKLVLEKFAQVLHIIQQEKFNSPALQEIAAKARQADQKVHALASLVNALDARQNSMTNLVVNSLLLYDLQCVYRLEKWKEENAHNLITWLDVIATMESFCSVATFAFNHESFVYPSVGTALAIEATGLGHPLISQPERITNDVHISQSPSVLIITGANMAGKSTFLRTIGVNLVLALAGAPVCADKFYCPILQLRSGMRTADSLKDHQSYFYAELDRLQSIMNELRNGQPLFILLDEILKGTNSTDKQTGSIALVKQLLAHQCLALIATHDIVLGELEKDYPERIRNYCFEAIIEKDQLLFDYKLKSGIAQKMNATFLMKKMGIIPA